MVLFTDADVERMRGSGSEVTDVHARADELSAKTLGTAARS